MSKAEIIEKTKEFIRNKLQGEGSGHDWWHIYRVWNNAKYIGKMERVDMFVVELAALLHDIADWKFNKGSEDAGAKEARKWLELLEVEDNIISHVCEIVATSSFRGAGVKSKMRTLEGKVVQDSDRLDAIGAIGIGRTFAYGGHIGRGMYDPDIKPQRHETAEEYKKNNSTTINHFYEKLLLLKNLMSTESAKKIAAERHKYMEDFLKRFYNEWDGKM